MLVLLKDLNNGIVLKNNVEPSSHDEFWTRCLKLLPVFTLKDINLHRLSSGKNKKNTAISKKLERRK